MNLLLRITHRRSNDFMKPRFASMSLRVITALAVLSSWIPTTRAESQLGEVRGTIFTIDPDGSRSVIPGANVTLKGRSASAEAVSDEQGHYRFAAVPAESYVIDVKAPSLAGTASITVVAGATSDVPVELKVEAVKDSVTVEGTSEPAITT